MADYETFQFNSMLNVSDLALSMPVLTADFGDGYGAGALVGAASGLRRWALSSQLLPDMDEYSVDYDVDGEQLSAARFEYVWSFYRRHLAQGNKPFFIRDPRTKKKFLASFADRNLSFQALTGKLYSGSLTLVQRRARGLVFAIEDGSYVQEAPSSPRLSGQQNSATDFLLTWTESEDNNGVAGYQVRANSSFIVDVGNVLEYIFGVNDAGVPFDFEVRAYDGDAEPHYSDWSNLITLTLSTPAVTNYLLNSTGGRFILENGNFLTKG